jgi:hypothetical protein
MYKQGIFMNLLQKLSQYRQRTIAEAPNLTNERQLNWTQKNLSKMRKG